MSSPHLSPPLFVSKESFGVDVNWPYFVAALETGHTFPKPQIADVFLGPSTQTLLSRAAYIEGFGYGVKSVTAFGENPAKGLPTVQGAMLVFDPDNGSLRATIDSNLLTNIKTAADSALGAKQLARKDSKILLVIGAGSVAKNIVHAFAELFSNLETILIWNRTTEKAEQLARQADVGNIHIKVAHNLAEAVAQADIISTSTMAQTPILQGDWVKPGTHVDLIGAFRADMREADDALLQKASIFVDSRDTTLHHIGELKIPLEAGIISESDILADHYEMVNGFKGRRSDEDITVFKNGGGAHLDLMIAHAILKTYLP